MSYVIDHSGRSVETYIMQVDNTSSATYTYIGEAEPGSLGTAAVWRIMQVTNANGSIAYADSGNFSQVWNNRTGLTYA